MDFFGYCLTGRKANRATAVSKSSRGEDYQGKNI